LLRPQTWIKPWTLSSIIRLTQFCWTQVGVEDGLSLAKWVREDQQFRHTPVIAVTAHAMVTDQERVMQAGCNACVSKPIDFRLLKRQLAIGLPEVRFGV
jgi:CheY-like chemotaxis protein